MQGTLIFLRAGLSRGGGGGGGCGGFAPPVGGGDVGGGGVGMVLVASLADLSRQVGRLSAGFASRLADESQLVG